MTEECFNNVILAWYNYYSAKATDNINDLDIEVLGVDTVCRRDEYEINKSHCVCNISENESIIGIKKQLVFNTIDLVELNKDKSISDINCIDFEIIDS